MCHSLDEETGPLEWSGLGCALLALLLAAGALLLDARTNLVVPLGLGTGSLAAALLPPIGVAPRRASLVLAGLWTVGASFLVAWGNRQGPPLGLVAVGPLLALLLLGRREALAAGGIAIGLVGARIGADTFTRIGSWDETTPVRIGLGLVTLAATLGLAWAASALRTRVLRRTRLSLARSDALIRALPDTVLCLDREGRVQEARWAPPFVAPPRWRDRRLGEVLPDCPSLVQPLTAEAPSEPFDAILAGPTGTRTIEVRLGVGGPETRVVLLRDVTLERARERHREEWVRDVERAESMSQTRLLQAGRLAHMGVLAAGVAHEINNPLAYVLGNLEYARDAMERGERSADLTEAIAEAADGARRIRDIVEDIRLFSRSDDSDHLELARLSEVASSAVRVVRAELRQRAQLREEHGPAPLVFANPSRLAQVVVNLLVNAIQAMPEDRPEPGHVILRTGTTEQGEAFVEVTDDGVGIDEAHRRRVFEPFFTTRPIGQGTGLGLSICYGLIRRLGGEMDVESEVGRGSTFRIRLPNGEMLLDAG